VEQAREKYRLSERQACRLLGQWRETQRYESVLRTDEDALTQSIVALASEYGRYVHRRITIRLRGALKVPQIQRPRRRLWLNEGSCVRLRPERANHFWSYDFVSAMTHEGRTLRLLVLLDE
jgi:hypothetical protein